MKKSYKSSSLIGGIVLFVLLFSASAIQAQVGIGTTNPNASSALDISSTTKGLLTPRMTTTQRNAIVAPAESLLVFDTTVDAFYFYNTTTNAWVKLANEGTIKRNNYKLVKSVADLAPELTDGGGSRYLLQTNTYYEINGTINLAFPIDLNNAYVGGLDANEDVLSFPTGTVFAGSTGGSIRNITIKGARAFNITGPGISTNSSLLVQNTIIDGMTTDVGNISGLGLYFGNIVQFLNNANGITYSNIGNLLLSNQGWFGDNRGTFETFTGSFGLVEKVSGFSTANGTAIAIDVNSNPNVGNGVIIATVFSGNTTAPSGFVRRYSTGSYPGYNFTNVWSVNCPGIPREGDSDATANLYFDSSSVVNITDTNPLKLPVATTSIRNFRTNGNTTNRVVYEGRKSRGINVFASISFTATGGSRYSFSIYKNGVLVPGTEAIYDVLQTNQRQTVSVIGTVDITPSQYIEIYVRKITPGNEQFLTTSYNLIVN